MLTGIDVNDPRARAAMRHSLQLAHGWAAYRKAQREAEAEAGPRIVPVVTAAAVTETAESDGNDDAPHMLADAPAASPDVPETTAETPPAPILELRTIIATVEAYLARHPETADECALRGMTPGETRFALAHALYGDALLLPLGSAFPSAVSDAPPTAMSLPTETPATGEEEESCRQPTPLRLLPPTRPQTRPQGHTRGPTSTHDGTPRLTGNGLPRAARRSLRVLRGGPSPAPSSR